MTTTHDLQAEVLTIPWRDPAGYKQQTIERLRQAISEKQRELTLLTNLLQELDNKSRN